MATRDEDDPLTRMDRGRTRTPETVALSRLAARDRSTGRPWYASWWVPVAVVAVMLVLLATIAG